MVVQSTVQSCFFVVIVFHHTPPLQIFTCVAGDVILIKTVEGKRRQSNVGWAGLREGMNSRRDAMTKIGP